MGSLTALQFRDFIFKTNPEKISVSHAKNVVSHFCPGKSEITQDMGERARVAVLSGSFWGESFAEAMRQLNDFRAKSGEAGMLFLPGFPPFAARLTDFAFDAIGDGRIIPYTMRFVEVMTL